MSRLKHLIREIHRRSMWQVLGIYVVAGWVAYQVVQSLTEGLRLPEWFPALAIVLLIIGLPIVLATAFVQEGMGGEGAGAEPSAEDASPEPATRPAAGAYLFTWRNALSGGVLAFAALGFTGALWIVLGGATVRMISTEGVSEELLNSVAVLPFKTVGSDEESLNFAAGLHGDLTTQLSKVASLKVTSQTSTSLYLGTTKSLPEIAAELNVLVLLEGVVQRAGNQLRVQAQLIDGRTDEHLWAETFDRPFTVENVLSIQSDIARLITTALRATLTKEEQAAIEELPTESEEAFSAYLEGMVHAARRGRDESRQAIERLEAAVRIDPSFAVAWAALAAERSRAIFQSFAGPESWDAVREAEAKAIALAPDAFETLLAQGLVAYRSRRDYQTANRHFEAALVKRPGDSAIHLWLATMLKRQGRYEEAIPGFERAARLDPAAVTTWVELVIGNRWLARFEDVDRAAARGLLLKQSEGTALAAYWYESLILRGDTARARALLDEGTDQYGAFYWALELDHYFQRDFQAVSDSLVSRRPDGFGATISGARLGVLHLQAGEEQRARAFADSVKVAELQALNTIEGRDLPFDEAAALRRLALAELVLGNGEAARERNERALEILESRDAIEYGLARLEQAVIELLLGDHDAALESLEGNLAVEFLSVSPGILRLDPLWDPLRDNPRFQALLELERPGPVGP